MSTPKIILTDVEGTTTAIAYVKDTLFPFAANELENFLAVHGTEPEVAAIIEDVRALAPVVSPVATLRRWMAADEKITSLKALQGLIWEAGYRDGRLRGHLWPDVAACLRAWHASGIGLAVFSSGSVDAQKQLFGNSIAGDLTPLFQGFFDTRIGSKREMPAYAAIARTLRSPPGAILFLSDVAEELDAAAGAGMQVCQLVRAGDGTRDCRRYHSATDFADVARRFGLPEAKG